MPNLLNRKGQVFGRLEVIRRSELPLNNRVAWECLCSCGKTKTITSHDLGSGRVNSCGCLRKELNITTFTTHGHAPAGKSSPEYRSWANMRTRCLNDNFKDSKNYSARGITLCNEWLSFENFFADMGPKPSLNHSIERLDNDKGYEKSNCVWATRAVQSVNKRNTIFMTHDGVTLPLMVWAEKLGMPSESLRSRKYKGWSDEDIITIPVSRHNTYIRRKKNKTVWG